MSGHFRFSGRISLQFKYQLLLWGGIFKQHCHMQQVEATNERHCNSTGLLSFNYKSLLFLSDNSQLSTLWNRLAFFKLNTLTWPVTTAIHKSLICPNTLRACGCTSKAKGCGPHVHVNFDNVVSHIIFNITQVFRLSVQTIKIVRLT
jgi:hypothetical protein